MEAQSKGCADRFAIVRILRRVCQPFTGDGQEEYTYYPTTYLSCLHEVLAATLIVARFLPLLVPSSQLDEFDYKVEVGIGSISMAMSSFNVGLAWRYWWLSRTYSCLMAEPSTCASSFNSFARLVLAISTNFFLCLWLIPHKQDPTKQVIDEVVPLRAIGRGIIACYALTLYGAYLGNLLEHLISPRSDTIKLRHKAFAIVYGLCVIYLLSVLGYPLLAHGQQMSSWRLEATSWPTQVALILWIGCLACITCFMPQAPALVMIFQVGSVDDEEDDAEADEPRNCNCSKRLVKWSSIAYLLNQRLDSRIFYPRFYLGATHEVFAFTLIITWLLTLIVPAFRPQIFEHPARGIVGSVNPCFGWDYAPASWISVPLCSFNIYLSYRYAWLKLMRKSLLKDPVTLATRFNTFATYALAVSSNLWLCLWVIGPNPKDPVGGDFDGPEIFWWSLHTGIFVFYAASAYGAYLGNLVDILLGPRRDVVELKHNAFAIIYGLSVGYMLFVYGYSLANYENDSKEPALGSGIFTQVADIVWMGCVANITNFLPREPPLRKETVSESTIFKTSIAQELEEVE